MLKLLKQVSLILLSGLIVNSSVFADTIPNAVQLTKGQVAPFTGVELSDSYVKEVYKELNDSNKYKLLCQSLEQSIVLYQKNEVEYKAEITELTQQNTTLDTALQKANTNSFWKNTLWFLAGVLLTGGITYATRSH
jgi:hypothetical protein